MTGILSKEDLASISKLDKISYLKRLEIKDKMYEFATICHRNCNGDKMRFDTFQHMIELYDDGALFKDVVIVGATQIGKTDWLIIYILAAAYCGLNIFYILPHNKMRDKYVQEKILKPISTSDEYKNIKKQSIAQSVEQMQFGDGIIRFVSANVRSEMTSFSADIIVIDETDQIKDDSIENVELGLGRTDGSPHKFRRFISNPGSQSGFITEWYNKSDKRVRMCPCDKCDQYSEINWFKSVIREIEDSDGVVINTVLRDTEWERGLGRDIYIKCPKTINGESCGGNLDRLSPHAHWEATAESSQGIVGYHMPSLISYIVKVQELWFEYRDAMDSPSKKSAFYSRRLAIPYTETGHKVSEGVLQRCAEDKYFFQLQPDCAYSDYSIDDCECVMGIDVSPSHLDVSISMLERNKQRLVYIGKIDPQADYMLHELIERYKVSCAIIDSGPESLFSQTFQKEAVCDVWRCKYRGIGEDRSLKYNEIDLILSVDRTEALDRAYSRFKMSKVILPENYMDILDGTYIKEIQALSRRVDEDNKGQLKVTWVGSDSDHARHADAYRNLAALTIENAVLSSDSIYIG